MLSGVASPSQCAKTAAESMRRTDPEVHDVGDELLCLKMFSRSRKPNKVPQKCCTSCRQASSRMAAPVGNDVADGRAGRRRPAVTREPGHHGYESAPSAGILSVIVMKPVLRNVAAWLLLPFLALALLSQTCHAGELRVGPRGTWST